MTEICQLREKGPSMKKVRFLIGAVGAAPVLGMMMPATPGLAAVHSPKPGAKAVSLRHSAVTRTAGGLAVHPDTSGCTGNTEVHVTRPSSLSTKFWYKNAANGAAAACIGTVEGTWFDAGDNPQYDFRVRIYSGTGTRKRGAYSKLNGATIKNLTTDDAEDGVHRWFGYSRGFPIQVCTAWVFVGGPLSPAYSVVAGPQCTSVR
jgi:hypothetical protein